VKTYKPWKVLHLKLQEGIPTLPHDPGLQGFYVVFWWHGIPLGQQEIAAAQLPMPASQLAELALQSITPAVGDHLFEQGFKACLPVGYRNASPHPPPDFHALMALKRPLDQLRERLLCGDALPAASVSVVVCTRNRPESLVQCLHSLQNLAQRPQEILVVDNAPNSDATYQLVRQMSGIRYVPEPRPGLSVARNTGIRSSTGNIIAFTDDDVTVHPDWLARLVQGFDNPRVMAVTGLVLPAELETEAQVMFQQVGGSSGWEYQALTFDTLFFEQMKRRGVPVWRIGAGANMAFRRRAFELVGDFDERLGAGASGCSEDSELWYRVIAEGWQCRYEPTAVVHHYHRRDMPALKHQMYQYMQGHMVALLVQFDKYRHWGNLYRAFVVLPGNFTRSIVCCALRGFQPKASTLSARILGCAAGIKFYLKHRKT
jgi:GT2 family glycosyltransferase